MLLIIIFLLVTIVSFIIARSADINWSVDGWIIGSLSAIGLFITIVVLIVNMCIAPLAQARYEQQYTKLLSKVAYIDSYNHDEVVAQVDDWNYNYRKNMYGKTSPWVGIFYTIDTSTTDLIELNGGIEENE